MRVAALEMKNNAMEMVDIKVNVLPLQHRETGNFTSSTLHFLTLSVSFLGAPPTVLGLIAPSYHSLGAETGGLVARGEGTDGVALKAGGRKAAEPPK